MKSGYKMLQRITMRYYTLKNVTWGLVSVFLKKSLVKSGGKLL